MLILVISFVKITDIVQQDISFVPQLCKLSVNISRDIHFSRVMCSIVHNKELLMMEGI